MKYAAFKILLVIMCSYYPLGAADLTVINDTLHSAINQPTESVIKKLSANKDMFYTFGEKVINDSIVQLYKSLGVTSIESYVTWESCERAGEGQWDWSKWDKIVRVLKDNNMKWVPFLILGPAYSTPDWFRASKDHIPCCCLEHGIDSKIESLWNPNLPKRVDRFIAEFSMRYKETGVIESVLLGIQGDFGEAIYSASGIWTYNVPGKYHNHVGYWCNDPYALADFREFTQKRYVNITKLNKTWGTGFNGFSSIDFPGREGTLEAFEAKVKTGDPQARRRWLDFIDWYRASMTNWADWWISKTREYFADTPIYLCTGGDGKPQNGSNFAEQTRVAAKYGAGVRITNEGSNYADNFSKTRLVASAGKHYGTYYGFEPAGKEDAKGIVARIYNATASGANQLHDYARNVTSTKESMNVQHMHLKYLSRVDNPIVSIALWYPNTSLTLNWSLIPGYREKAAQLRDYTDFDYVDETMLRTGALGHNRILLIIQGEIMEPSDAKCIMDWITKGGRVIVMDVPKFESVEGTFETEDILFGSNGSNDRMIGKGRIVRVSGWGGLSETLRIIMSELRLPVCDLMKDSIFVTQIGKDKWFFLNTSVKSSIIRIELPGLKRDATIKPETITEVDLSKFQ